MYSSDLARASQTAERTGRHPEGAPSFSAAPGNAAAENASANLSRGFKNPEGVQKRWTAGAFGCGKPQRQGEPAGSFFRMSLPTPLKPSSSYRMGILPGVLHIIRPEPAVEARNRCELAGSAGGLSELPKNEKGKRLVQGRRSVVSPDEGAFFNHYNSTGCRCLLQPSDDFAKLFPDFFRTFSGLFRLPPPAFTCLRLLPLVPACSCPFILSVPVPVRCKY